MDDGPMYTCMPSQIVQMHIYQCIIMDDGPRYIYIYLCVPTDLRATSATALDEKHPDPFDFEAFGGAVVTPC